MMNELEQYLQPNLQATSVCKNLRTGSLVVAPICCTLKHTIKHNHFNNFVNKLGRKFDAGGN